MPPDALPNFGHPFSQSVNLLTCQQQGYLARTDWARLPSEITWKEIAGVALNDRDELFVFARDPHQVTVFDKEGNYLRHWGQGVFTRPHGIEIGPDGCVYCTDDFGHAVHKFTQQGELLLVLGSPGQPSETGATSVDYRTILHSAGPFHYPTNVALDVQGDILIADGYGNARVHRFDASGRLLHSWGEPGAGPGQFHVPHGIAVDGTGVIWVADRENCRLQRFSPAGEFLGEWTGMARPTQVCLGPSGTVLVSELGFLAGMWSGTEPPVEYATGGRLSMFDAAGKLIARWGTGLQPHAPGDFQAPHDLCVDSQGNLFVAEVMASARTSLLTADKPGHPLTKFCVADRADSLS